MPSIADLCSETAEQLGENAEQCWEALEEALEAELPNGTDVVAVMAAALAGVADDGDQPLRPLAALSPRLQHVACGLVVAGSIELAKRAKAKTEAESDAPQV